MHNYSGEGPATLNSGDELYVTFEDSNLGEIVLWTANSSNHVPTSEWSLVTISLPTMQDPTGNFRFVAKDMEEVTTGGRVSMKLLTLKAGQQLTSVVFFHGHPTAAIHLLQYLACLTESDTYVVSVRATDSDGQISDMTTTNGVTIDLTLPVISGCREPDISSQVVETTIHLALMG